MVNMRTIILSKEIGRMLTDEGRKVSNEIKHYQRTNNASELFFARYKYQIISTLSYLRAIYLHGTDITYNPTVVKTLLFTFVDCELPLTVAGLKKMLDRDTGVDYKLYNHLTYLSNMKHSNANVIVVNQDGILYIR